MKKIILRLEGGLGNQLFQYAFAREIQFHTGADLSYDIYALKCEINDVDLFKVLNCIDEVVAKSSGSFKIYVVYHRYRTKILNSLISRFISNALLRDKILSKIGVLYQKGVRFRQYYYGCSSNVIYIRGNWMSDKFFSSVSEDIRNELYGFCPNSNKVKATLDLIQSHSSTAVHIRRGDYTSKVWADRLLVCNKDYYEKGIDFIKNRVPEGMFFIFSNSPEDIEWIRANYNLIGNITYVDEAFTGIEDFYLMSRCKNYIVSNSTFSWWASYLNIDANKIVVAPSKWNNDIWDMTDLYCENWRLIDIV